MFLFSANPRSASERDTDSDSDHHHQNQEVEDAQNWVNKLFNTSPKYVNANFRHIHTPDNLTFEAFDQNTIRNRYGTSREVRCVDATRVHLKFQGNESDYIHANYVSSYNNPKRFICTQGPIGGRTDRDFWTMVLNERVKIIVMLCNLSERGRNGIISSKCADYWPKETNVILQFGAGNAKILLDNVTNSHKSDCLDDPDIDTTVIEATWTDQETNRRVKRRIRHYHWKAWEDFKAPLTMDTCIKLSSLIRKKTKRPVVVHCSAGIGRTGTFVAIIRSQEYMQHGTGFDSMNKLLNDLRSERYGAIKEGIQMIYYYRVILHYILELKPQITGNMLQDDDVKTKYETWIRRYNRAIDCDCNNIPDDTPETSLRAAALQRAHSRRFPVAQPTQEVESSDGSAEQPDEDRDNADKPPVENH